MPRAGAPSPQEVATTWVLAYNALCVMSARAIGAAYHDGFALCTLAGYDGDACLAVRW